MNDNILKVDVNQTTAEQKKEIFTKVIDKKELAQSIFSSFLGKNAYRRTAGINGFFTSEVNTREIGILTQCQGLIGMSYLAKMNDKILDNTKDILNVIGSIDSSIIKEDGFEFNVTPYISEEIAGTKITGYIDTIAKVLMAASEFRTSLFNVGTDFELTEEELKLIPSLYQEYKKDENFSKSYTSLMFYWTEKVMLECINRLNDSAIKLPEPESYYIGTGYKFDDARAQLQYNGWNFTKYDSYNTKEEYEQSFYFTFIASSAYQSIFDNMTESFNDLLANTGSIKELIDKSDTKDFEYRKNIEFLGNNWDKITAFTKRVYDAGHYIDLQIRKADLDISTYFIGKNYKPVTFDAISASTTNDALFNTLFAVAIMLNAGVDMEYNEYYTNISGQTTEADSNNVSENFYEDMQAAIQNVQRCYKKLENEKRSYIVDQYVLSFNEDIPQSLEAVTRALRKQRIQTLSLVPLMIRVYTSISKYIIKYPQKQMNKYFNIICNNRCKENVWLWDKEGYNLNTTVYYIMSLYDFFEYYEEYELPYVDGDSARAKVINEMTKKHADELERIAKTKEDLIIKIQQEKETLNIDLENARNEKTPLELEIEKYLRNTVSTIFNELITKFFEDFINYNYFKEDNPNAELFKKAIMSMFSKGVYEHLSFGKDMAYEGKRIKEERDYHAYDESVDKIYEKMSDVIKSVVDKLNQDRGDI